MKDDTKGVKILAEASAIHSVKLKVTYRNHKSTRNTSNSLKTTIFSPMDEMLKAQQLFLSLPEESLCFHSTLKSICQPDK